MSHTPEVEAWFAELHHPLEPAMRRVRDIILGADPWMTGVVQYGIALPMGVPSGFRSAVGAQGADG